MGGNILVVMPLFVCGWKSVYICGSVMLFQDGQDTDYIFAETLSNFTHKLFPMREGTLLILDYWVKGQGQLWLGCFEDLCSFTSRLIGR